MNGPTGLPLCPLRTSQFGLGYSCQRHGIIVTRDLPAPNRNLEPSSEEFALTDLNSLAATQAINSQVVADNSPLSMTGKHGDLRPRLALVEAN